MLQIDHVNIHARDPKAIVAFLEAALGAAEGERPPFKHPGHWVYLDGRPVFHIDHARGDEAPGLIDHIAIGVFDGNIPMSFATISTSGAWRTTWAATLARNRISDHVASLSSVPTKVQKRSAGASKLAGFCSIVSASFEKRWPGRRAMLRS